MTDDIYMVAITALLPLMAVLLVLQTNPYQALVIRGILGAIAALVYAMYGAADVALTEALVGTMLSITLYAIAVRSSMTLRVGMIDPYCEQNNPACVLPTETLSAISQAFDRYDVRVETLSYSCQTDLEVALQNKEIHVAYDPSSTNDLGNNLGNDPASELPNDLASELPNDIANDLANDPATDLATKLATTPKVDGKTDLLQVRTQQLYDILQPQMPKNVRLALIEFEGRAESQPQSTLTSVQRL